MTGWELFKQLNHLSNGDLHKEVVFLPFTGDGCKIKSIDTTTVVGVSGYGDVIALRPKSK